jgi:hypothetical protein
MSVSFPLLYGIGGWVPAPTSTLLGIKLVNLVCTADLDLGSATAQCLNKPALPIQSLGPEALTGRATCQAHATGALWKLLTTPGPPVDLEAAVPWPPPRFHRHDS